MKRIALLAVVMLVISTVSGQEPDLESVGYEAIAKEIHRSIEESGIKKSNINVSEKAVIISYQQPPVRSDADSLLMWTYIWTASAISHPDSSEVRIIQYNKNLAMIEIVAKTTDIKDYITKKITFDAFGKTLDFKSPPEKPFDPCPPNAKMIGGRCFCSKGMKIIKGKCVRPGILANIDKGKALKVGLVAALLSLPVIIIGFFAVAFLVFLIIVWKILKRRKKKKQEVNGKED